MLMCSWRCTLLDTKVLTITIAHSYNAHTYNNPPTPLHTIFYGILLISGYNTVPRRRLLWSDDYDVSNTAVKDAMRRNRFDEIMSSVHLVDNIEITADPFFKVRPLFKHLNDINKCNPDNRTGGSR